MMQSDRPEEAGSENYEMLLFVAGDEPNSRLAKDNLKRICDAHLYGRCRPKVIDVMKDFQSALEHNVLVTPMLILVEPLPQARVFGNLSDSRKVVEALRLTGD